MDLYSRSELRYCEEAILEAFLLPIYLLLFTSIDATNIRVDEGLCAYHSLTNSVVLK
jgi:hypothetical protein